MSETKNKWPFRSEIKTLKIKLTKFRLHEIATCQFELNRLLPVKLYFFITITRASFDFLTLLVFPKAQCFVLCSSLPTLAIYKRFLRPIFRHLLILACGIGKRKSIDPYNISSFMSMIPMTKFHTCKWGPMRVCHIFIILVTILGWLKRAPPAVLCSNYSGIATVSRQLAAVHVDYVPSPCWLPWIVLWRLHHWNCFCTPIKSLLKAVYDLHPVNRHTYLHVDDSPDMSDRIHA